MKKPSTTESKPSRKSTHELQRVSELLERLAEAKSQHIRDLSTVLEQSAAREEKLIDILQAQIAPREIVSNLRPGVNVMQPTIESDVATYDEQADAEMVRADASAAKEAEHQFFSSIMTEIGEIAEEEDAYHSTRTA